MKKRKRDNSPAAREVSPSAPSEPLIPIVGIGASAGGLEAFKEVLGHLTADTGMAFVLVQHLSPQHESFLSEILSKWTSMPVIEVIDGVRAKPNHVYVIPPNVSMRIKDGHLRLVGREAHERPHLPIDFFFRSLAHEQKNEAIGVVLSGTGSDGAEGLKTIKGEGGITFAQSPESARFGGMPQRAISVDHVDFVLTPKEIAQELVKISKHPYLRSPALDPDRDDAAELPETAEHEDELLKILHLLKESTDVDFSGYKHTTVKRRIMRRMLVHKVEHLSAYYDILRENRAEQIALKNDILINVTSFFRDPEVFDKLQSSILPAILKNRRKGDAIRIWVPGCATGEEVYSIAIVVLEQLGERASEVPIQIFGSDLSDVCISKARAGKYMEGIEENVSRERLRRFFVRSDKGFSVGKSVRDLCVFAKQDVVNDPPYSRLDLISCRNLLIYLEPILQRKVLSTFSYALKPSGFLLLGNSETPNTAPALFSPVEKKEKIYSINRSLAQARPIFSVTSQMEALSPSTPQISKPPRVVDPIEKETDHLLVSHYAPPSVVINDQFDVIQFRGDTTPFLVNQSRRASFNVLKMARDGLAPPLKMLVETARNGGSVKKNDDVRIRSEGGIRSVSIEATPLRSAAGCLLIVFRENTGWSTQAKPSTKSVRTPQMQKADEASISELTHELAQTKAYLESLNRDLESANQDLQSANEEVLSANEELQSTNEELETAKEELQSGNEELTTVNDELQSRNSELDRLNNDLTNLLGSIEIPVLMISKDGRIRTITPAAQRALSLQSGDVGRPIREIKSNFDVLGLDLDLEQKVAEVVDSMMLAEIEIQDRSGHWFRLQVRPYRTLDNRIDGAVVALIDIDALKRNLAEINHARAEAEAARASAEAGNRAKDLFLATLSHELRTPLTTILSFSQLLRLGKLDEEDSKKGILMIEQSALSQAQLINDLLDVSRIIMGKLSLDIQNVNPKMVFHSAVESVRPLAEKKSIRIEKTVSDEEVEVRVDPVRLKQVILNILTNAIKFSHLNGTIEASLQILSDAGGDSIRIVIRDFGKGIPAKFLPHLFDRFSQADSSSTRVHGGMGLGLAIVRSLTEAQGGNVRAESDGEGAGSTFTVTFPAILKGSEEQRFQANQLYVPSLDTGGGTVQQKEHPNLKNLRILFVDDDPSARESLGTLLRSLGAAVEVVDSARAALAALPVFRPDVLVSDLAMPGENGYALIKQIRLLTPDKLGDIPALALTAFAGLEDAKRALAAGFQAHMAKPVGSLDLALKILELTRSS